MIPTAGRIMMYPNARNGAAMARIGGVLGLRPTLDSVRLSTLVSIAITSIHAILTWLTALSGSSFLICIIPHFAIIVYFIEKYYLFCGKKLPIPKFISLSLSSSRLLKTHKIDDLLLGTDGYLTTQPIHVSDFMP